MEFTIGDVALSLSGHDQGRCYAVIGKDKDIFLLADGKHRRIEKPKKKSKKHLRLLGHLAVEGTLSNKQLWRELRAYRNMSEETKGGFCHVQG